MYRARAYELVTHSFQVASACRFEAMAGGRLFQVATW